MRRRLLLAVLLACSVAAAGTAQRASEPRAPDAAEFPPFDSSAFSLLRGGLIRKDADRRLSAAPDDPATAALLVEVDRLDDALDVLQRIVDRHPERIWAAFAGPSGMEASNFGSYPGRPHVRRLLELVAVAREKTAALPREQAAEAAFALAPAEGWFDAAGRGQARLDRVRALIAKYAGTIAAQLAQVDLIRSGPLTPAMLDRLEAFASAHPRTIEAAMARFQIGFDLAHNATALRIDTGGDPMPRFARVRAIVRDLQSGAYPSSEWVDRAPELLTGFFMYQPRFAGPADIDAMLAVYRDLVHTQAAGNPDVRPGDIWEYVLTRKMGDLHALRGDRTAGVEREFDALEAAAVTPAAIRLVRAQYYLRRMVEEPNNHPQLMEKATAVLEALHAANTEPHSRRALATLASARFHQRDYAAARAVYERYLQHYPDSDWAWVARLRLGQSHRALNDPAAAASVFMTVADARDAWPFARALASAMAADALAVSGRLPDAVTRAEAALAGWDDDHGTVYRIQANQALLPGEDSRAIRRDMDVDRQMLPARIDQLRLAASVPGGDALERAREAMRQTRYREARDLLGRSAAANRGTPFERAARTLAHEAWLAEALALADVESAARRADDALRELTGLGDEPTDFPVVAARISRATLLAQSGSPDAAGIMRDALRAWQDDQPLSAPAAAGSLDADLDGIRQAVFRPQGGGVYTGGRWNAFQFPDVLPSFLVINPGTPVTLATGEALRVVRRAPIPSFDNVLYMDDAELGILTSVMRSLGGTQDVWRATEMVGFWIT